MPHPSERDPVSQVCLAVAVLCAVGLLLVGYELQAGIQRELGAVEEEARHLGRELDASIARRRAALLDEAQQLVSLGRLGLGVPGPAATTPRPDGQVVFAEQARGSVWVRSSRRHALRLAARFLVYRFARDGRRRRVGVVQVCRVERGLARCRTVLREGSDPIARGDLLRLLPSEQAAR